MEVVKEKRLFFSKKKQLSEKKQLRRNNLLNTLINSRIVSYSQLYRKHKNMERIKRKKGQRRKRLGPTGQKILLILAAGASLSLTRRPDRYFNVIKSASKEWQKINRKSLHDAIQRLYQSQLIKCVNNKDGTITLTLTADGKERILNYDVDTLEIKKQNKWDGLWRIVVFDIPEFKKRARDALSFKLKNMGMLAMQKSVFVCPYECKDEIDFVVEFFDLKPFVRFIVAKNIDIVLDLKQKFRLL